MNKQHILPLIFSIFSSLSVGATNACVPGEKWSIKGGDIEMVVTALAPNLVSSGELNNGNAGISLGAGVDKLLLGSTNSSVGIVLATQVGLLCLLHFLFHAGVIGIITRGLFIRVIRVIRAINY